MGNYCLLGRLRMERLRDTLSNFIENYSLSSEFESCLRTLLVQHEGGIFSQLCKLHFQMNDGIETKDIRKVFYLLELWVLFTDIVDDIEDGDEEKWGVNQNILLNASTALISIVFLELQKLSIPFRDEVRQLFCHYLISATDGQHHDLINQIQSEETYIDVVKRKSGSIIALACTLGETLAKGNHRVKLEACAHNIAIVGQLNNDFEDLLGKQTDIYARKRTLPLLYLLEYEDPMFDKLRQYYMEPIHTTNKIYINTDQIVASGLPIYMDFMKSKYRNNAFELLHQLYPYHDISKFEKFI